MNASATSSPRRNETRLMSGSYSGGTRRHGLYIADSASPASFADRAVPRTVRGKASAADAPTGVIGAAVLRAARRSTGLGQRAFARRIGTSRLNLWSWEAGTCPLYAVSYDQLCEIANALREAGAAVGGDACELIIGPSAICSSPG